MKFSFYSGFNQMLQEKGLESTAAWAQENGFSAVEFLQVNIENWYSGVQDVAQANEVKKTLRSYGLTTACYSVATNLLNGDNAKTTLKQQAELAAALESPFLHHTLIDCLELPPNAPSFDEVFPKILDDAAEIALYCQKLGLTCLYEEQGLYFNGIENFGRFFNEIKKRCSNVGVCGDFGNILFVDESSENFLNAFKQDIRHVHLKDYAKCFDIEDLPDKEAWLKTKNNAYLKDVALGEGIIDIPACFDILRSADYQGFFSLEIVNPTVNNAQAIQLSKTLYK